jgi:hypothetical protein
MATYIGKVKAWDEDRLLVFYNIHTMRDLFWEADVFGYNPYDVCFAQIDDMVSSFEFTITELKDGNNAIPILEYSDQGDNDMQFYLLDWLHDRNLKWFYLSEDLKKYLPKAKV